MILVLVFRTTTALNQTICDDFDDFFHTACQRNDEEWSSEIENIKIKIFGLVNFKM